jgi:hypothetical protein
LQFFWESRISTLSRKVSSATEDVSEIESPNQSRFSQVSLSDVKRRNCRVAKRWEVDAF